MAVREWTDEQREAQRQRALEQVATGRFGGRQEGAGRPRSGVPKVSELVEIVERIALRTQPVTHRDDPIAKAIIGVTDGAVETFDFKPAIRNGAHEELSRLVVLLIDTCVSDGTLPARVHYDGDGLTLFYRDKRSGRPRETELSDTGIRVKSNLRLDGLDTRDFRTATFGQLFALLWYLEQLTERSEYQTIARNVLRDWSRPIERFALAAMEF